MSPSLLDDHHVRTAPARYKASAFLLAHAPPRLHLAILTQKDPLLPASTLRACGQLAGATFAVVWTEGGGMAFEQAVAYALGD